jgi:hypothetical protein
MYSKGWAFLDGWCILQAQKDTLPLRIYNGIIWCSVLHEDLSRWKFCLQSLCKRANSLILQATVDKQFILQVIRKD